MDLEQRIAAELRAELARQDKSRHWLAEQTGIPVTTIARWLRGPQSPGLNELDAICRALGVSVSRLMGAVDQNGGYLPLTAGEVRHQGLEPRTRWFGVDAVVIPFPAHRRTTTRDTPAARAAGAW